VDQVHTRLIKLGHPFHAPFDRLRGRLQPRRRERIPQEVEAPADPADERLVRAQVMPHHVRTETAVTFGP
jgi:hypothetical protein